MQTELNFTAERLRDIGMNMAIESAEKLSDESWGEKCYQLLKKYLLVNCQPFMTEYFRAWVETGNKLAEPPSKRAYGGIIARAHKSGLIKHCGYSQTSNVKAHKTPASVWQKI